MRYFLSRCAVSKSAQFRTHCQPSSACRRYNLPSAGCLVSSADRCSVSSVRVCVVLCVVRLVVCRVQSVRVCWMGQGRTGGVYSSRPAPPGQSFNHRKNKKGSKKHPTPYCQSQKFRKNKKDPYKGSVFCAILALQALKGRNLQ